MAHTVATLILLLLLICIRFNIINSQIINATYDLTFNTPSCLIPAMKCETNNTPVDGVYGVSSFELNSPNTIQNSCNDYSNSIPLPDNTSNDEYIARLLVRNADGLIMTGGQTVRIAARIMTVANTTNRIIPVTTGEEEVAHFYYAANASASPINWEYVATKTRPIGGGYKTVQTTVTLANTGGMQAVRINYGYGIYTPQECASDGLTNGEKFVDVDDLVFYVEPGPPTSSPTLPPTNSVMPSVSNEPSIQPSSNPTASGAPTSIPSFYPSISGSPSFMPSMNPSLSTVPSSQPSIPPTDSHMLSFEPSGSPSISGQPSVFPTSAPSTSSQPTRAYFPSAIPSYSAEPSILPSALPSIQPSLSPTDSQVPSSQPSGSPSISSQPSYIPSLYPSTSNVPSLQPSFQPTTSNEPTVMPTDEAVSSAPTTTNAVLPKLPTLAPVSSEVSSTAPSTMEPQTITATYDPTFNTPLCLIPAMKCETNNTPVDGVYGVSSFEFNSPNTIQNSCNDYSNSIPLPDNTSNDEHIARLLVRNTDGLIMTGGQIVRIAARVMTVANTTNRIIPVTTGEEEVAHFYYAANASASPVNWEYIETRTRPIGGGYKTVQTTVMLANTGGLQAVRINYGYGIYTPQECASDGLTNGEKFVDVDDLVFYVEPGPPTSSPTLSPTNMDIRTAKPSMKTESTLEPTYGVLLTEVTTQPSYVVTPVSSTIPTEAPSSIPSMNGEPTSSGSIAPSSTPIVSNELTISEEPTPTPVPSTTTQLPIISYDDDFVDDDELIFEKLLPFAPNSSTLANKGCFCLLLEAMAALYTLVEFSCYML